MATFVQVMQRPPHTICPAVAHWPVEQLLPTHAKPFWQSEFPQQLPCTHWVPHFLRPEGQSSPQGAVAPTQVLPHLRPLGHSKSQRPLLQVARPPLPGQGVQLVPQLAGLLFETQSLPHL